MINKDAFLFTVEVDWEMVRKRKKRRRLRLELILLLAVFIFGAYEYWTRFRYPVQGIDISHHQGKIDWQRVKGQDFVFIKATEGKSMVDPRFSENWQQAKEKGIIRGAYHFFLPSVSAEDQANHFLAQVDLKTGDLPPVLDVEETSGQSSEVIRKGVSKWVNIVEQKTGITPILYTSPSFYGDNLKGIQLDCPIWIAHYNPVNPRLPKGVKKWDFWQYSDKGKVRGIKEKVDQNYFNGSKQKLQELTIQQDQR